MTWWSLTCNIAREWRLMMADERAELATRSVRPRQACATTKSSVIYLAEVLRIRRERRLGASVSGPDAEASNVVYMSRGPRPRQRV
ncbi:Phage protein [compost metagenome]